MIETTVLSNLIYNDQYIRAVLPYIKPLYFQDKSQQIIFALIQEHFEQYKSAPTKEILAITLAKKSLSENIYEQTTKKIAELANLPTDTKWLTNETEQFCRNSAVRNALLYSFELYQKNQSNSANNMGEIEQIMKEAVSTSFDHSVGHDYLEDAEERYEFYHMPDTRIPFDIDIFNSITGGGLMSKTLLLLLLGTGVGKSLTMCHMSADYLQQGKNVVYISLEMSHEMLGKRIDANTMDITLDDVDILPKAQYMNRIKDLKGATAGKLIIKQFANGSNANHFRAFIKDVERKYGWTPDLICIDYLNICGSTKASLANGSYGYIKAVVEEVRDLGFEFDSRVVSATQVNRAGLNSSDLTLENISDSIASAFTADYVWAGWETEELIKLGQICWSQLKNRYGDKNKPSIFTTGTNKDKQKLYNLDDPKAKNAAPVIHEGTLPWDDNSEDLADKINALFTIGNNENEDSN